MKRRPPSRWAVILICLTLSCNILTPQTVLPTPTVPPTSAPTPLTNTSAPTASLAPSATPEPTPTATPEPFSPREVAPFVTGLGANLRARVASGEWTLEEGLVASLKFLAGQLEVSDIASAGVEIHTFEGNDIVRQAQGYIQSGSNEATKTELSRLLTLILPSAETLHKFAQPTPGQSNTGPSGRLARPASQTAECARLWADGFPEGSTLTCFEYQRVEVEGQTYEVFFPLDWAADDPRRAFFEPTVQAIQDSVPVFSRLGAMPATGTIVFTLLPDPVFPGAYAVTDQFTAGGSCQMAILPPGVGLGLGEYKQTVAHELFHCFQFANYYDAMLDEANDWWSEGSAEYFSNVVYPEVNGEAGFWNDFDINSIDHSLVDMDYENELFFQYLANRVGNDGVLQLLARMPASGGYAAQLTALAGFPEIRVLFHEFGKAYLDRQILDTSGDFVHVSPAVDHHRTFDSSHTETLLTKSFTLTRALFVFPDDTRHFITEDSGEDSLSDAEPLGVTGGWTALPSQLAAACDRRRYVYLVTLGSATSPTSEVRIKSEVEHFDGQCDPCLVGTWQMDNTSHWEAFISLIPADALGQPQLQTYTGSVMLTFNEDGTLSQSLDNWFINYTQDHDDLHADATMSVNGVIQSEWYTDGAGTLTVRNVANTLASANSMTITIGTTTTTKPLDIPFGVGEGLSLYQCSGDTLLLDPYIPSGVAGQFITHHRIEP